MDVQEMVRVMVAPAIFVSAGGLLLLSLNARMIAIVGRVRSVHERRGGEDDGALLEALNRRARLIRNALAATLVGVGCALLCCLLLGLGTVSPTAAWAGAALLVSSLVTMLVGVGYFLREVLATVPSLEVQHAGASRPRPIKGMSAGPRITAEPRVMAPSAARPPSEAEDAHAI
jgi:Protein of unknown function (DUF2721)